MKYSVRGFLRAWRRYRLIRELRTLVPFLEKYPLIIVRDSSTLSLVVTNDTRSLKCSTQLKSRTNAELP